MDKNKNKWISDKIRKLINEGEKRDRAAAIAYSMYENRQQGGYSLPMYQGGSYTNPASAPYPNIMNNFQPIPDLQNVFQSQMQSPGVQPTYGQPQEINQNQQNFRNIPSLAGTITPAGMVNIPSTSTITAPTQTEITTDLQQKQKQRATQYNDINRLQVAQLFGGVPLESAIYNAAYGFKQGNTWQGIGNSLLAGLKIGRIAGSGAGAGSENRRGMDYMRNQLYAPNTNYEYGQVGQNQTYGYYGQQGGRTPEDDIIDYQPRPEDMTDEEAKAFMAMYNEEKYNFTSGEKDSYEWERLYGDKAPKYDKNSARDTWVAKTGLPWSEAKKLGYTDGSAKDNTKLLSELNDPRFKKENLRRSNNTQKNRTNNSPQNRTNNTKQPTAKDFTYQEYQNFTKRLPKSNKNQGAIANPDEGNMLTRFGEYIANPLQTVGEYAKYGELPAAGFSKHDKNAYDQVIGLINPAYWTNAAGNAVDYATEGEYKKAGMEALDALPALGKLKYVKNVPIQKVSGLLGDGTSVGSGLAKVGNKAVSVAPKMGSAVGPARRAANLRNYFTPELSAGRSTKALPYSNPYLLFQEGGKVPTNAEMLTGDYITDQPNANLKIEDREYVKNSQTGQIQKAVGDKHEDESGGIPVNLPPQSQILSDFTPLKANNAKELSNRYKISLKPKDTPAKAMDKYNKKIGYDELVEKETNLTEKFEEQTKSSIDKTTKNVNLAFISKELEKISNEKEQLKPIQDIAFQDIFRVQESIPKKGRPGELIGKDGKVVKGTEQMAQQGGYSPSIIALSKKYQLTPQRITEIMQQGGEVENEEQMEGENEQAEGENAQLEQLEQAAEQAIQEGADPNEVLQQLIQQGVPQEVAVQIVQEITQEGESGGGSGQLIQAFAQATQQDPNQIAQQLQQLPPEQQQQAMQEMAQFLQQNPQEESAEMQMREGGYSLPMYQGGSYTKQQVIDRNNAAGTNLNTPSIWMGQTAANFYTPYNKWEESLGNQPTNINSHEVYQKGIVSNLRPQVSKLFETGKIPLDNKHRSLMKKAGIKNADKIFDYSQLSEADKKKLGKDFITTGYVDTLAGHRGVAIMPGEMTQEEYAKSKGAYDHLTDTEGRQIYAKYDDKGNILKDDKGNFVFYYPKKAGEPEKKVEPSKVTEDVKKTAEYQQQDQQVQNRMVTKTIAPNLFQPYIMPPSSLQVPYKPEVTLSRIDPTQQDIAAYENNINSQAQTAMSNNYHLSDVQRAANNANITAAAQIATNDARAKVTVANTAARERADLYNAQQADKEKLTNLGLNQQYETKVNQAINNTDIDLRKYFAQNNTQNRQNFRDVADINMVNANTDNYQTDGSNIYFNQQPLNIKNYAPDVNLQKMFEATKDNPEEREKLRQAIIKATSN